MDKRILFTFILVVLVAVLVTGFLSYNLLKVIEIELIKDRLINSSILIREFIINEDDVANLNFNDIAKEYSEHIETRVTFINEEGWVIGDSNADIKKLQNHKDRPEVKKALEEKKTGYNKRFSDSLKLEMYYVAIPIEISGSNVAVIRLSVPLSVIDYWNNVLLKYLLISIVSGLIIAIILSLRFIQRVTDPIKQLIQVTKKIANGNYGEKVYVRTGDEIGILAKNFNTMSDKLVYTINKMEERNSRTKAILSSMVNAVIALDINKKIIFVNTAAEVMFNFEEVDVKGKHILEIHSNTTLDEIITKTIETNLSHKAEIQMSNVKRSIININTNTIKLEEKGNRKIGVVVIFQDVTEIRKLETMRKDFVANVSHEIKTPLTSIRGFIETLKNGAIEEKKLRDKFFNIIEIEASRLTSLIDDILILSDIENKQNIISKDLIDLNQTLEEILDIMNEIAKKKEIKLISNINNNLANIYGNKGRFKQMVINLIDNAIKYTPKNGSVTLNSFEYDNKVVIKIKDTGIGIEKKHLPRLFERFYRVDKARTRQVGGTGLGLAIVKHIVISFNGTIKVKSELNKGSEFTIKLPINT